MEFRLNLGKHCIETAIRTLHNRLVSEYFKSNADSGRQVQLEIQLTVTEQALQQFDFGALRAGWPELNGGTDADITLTADDMQRPVLCINGKSITIPLEKNFPKD